MGSLASAFSLAFRDYNTDGVSGSGRRKPVKSEIRALGALLENTLGAGAASKSASYSMEPTDTGKTIVVTAGGVTISFDPATDYGTTQYNYVANSSTTRACLVSVNGYGSFFLYPLDVCMVIRTGSVWSVFRNPRYAPIAPLILYVNHATGNDNNDGLTTGSALATIQTAVYRCERDFDFGYYSSLGPTIKVADGTFTEANVVHTKRVSGTHVIYIEGNPSSPGSCVWRTNVIGSVCFTARDYSGAILNGFKFEATVSGATAISASQTGIIDVRNLWFGAFASGTHIQATSGGHIGYVSGDVPRITGNCAYHWLVDTSGSKLLCAGVTGYIVDGSLTMTQFLNCALGATVLLSGTTFTGSGAGSGLTGQKYAISQNAQVSLGGVTLPGATAGATSTGGQAN